MIAFGLLRSRRLMTASGTLSVDFRSFCGFLSDSSSSEDTVLNVRALATRLRVSERKVKQVIQELHVEGLPLYHEGDDISKVDAHVIAELGLGMKLPSATARKPRARHTLPDAQPDEEREEVGVPDEQAAELEHVLGLGMDRRAEIGSRVEATGVWI